MAAFPFRTSNLYRVLAIITEYEMIDTLWIYHINMSVVTHLPMVCLPSKPIWEYPIKLVAMELISIVLHIQLRYHSCRGVSGFVTRRPCGVWVSGPTIFPLYIGPFVANLLHISWFVSSIEWTTLFLSCKYVLTVIITEILPPIFWLSSLE